jgi:hypothetical protein
MDSEGSTDDGRSSAVCIYPEAYLVSTVAASDRPPAESQLANRYQHQKGNLSSLRRVEFIWAVRETGEDGACPCQFNALMVSPQHRLGGSKPF